MPRCGGAGYVPWAAATAIAAFGVWVDIGARSGWRWSGLLAGVVAAVAGAVLWSFGRVAAGVTASSAACARFVGTWAVRLDVADAVGDRLADARVRAAGAAVHDVPRRRPPFARTFDRAAARRHAVAR